jgi:zinc protease
MMSELVLYGLPQDYWQRLNQEVHEVTAEMAMLAAKNHLHPEALLIVVVGDREKIEPKLRELQLGNVEVLTQP